jgi:transcription antitermination factor NusG
LVCGARAFQSREQRAIQPRATWVSHFHSEDWVQGSARTQITSDSGAPSLFPGYVFLILDLSRDRWRAVNSAFGVASLIMGGEQPMPVPCGVVESLMMSENSGLVRLNNDPEIGQKVRILSGPFADALCRLVHLDDRGRVRVLLELMGTEVTAQLDRSSVAPAA